MISEVAPLRDPLTDICPSRPVQFYFFEWYSEAAICQRNTLETNVSIEKNIPKAKKVTKEVEIQPYLLPYPMVLDTEMLIADIEYTAQQWSCKDAMPSDSKIDTFQDLRGRARQTSAYWSGYSSDVNFLVPNPLTVRLDNVFGNFYEQSKKDQEISELLEEELRIRQISKNSDYFLPTITTPSESPV